MNRNQKYLRNRKRYNRRYLFIILIVLTISFFAFRKMNNIINIEIAKMTSQISEKKDEIESIKLDIDSLKEDYKNRNSDEFKEKIARERLNMIKKDEYVYKDNNN